jgi:molybdate transport system substrate-binding protein
MGKCLLSVAAGVCLLGAGGVFASSAGAQTPARLTAASGSGPVNVLYAGSLVDLMTKQVGPAFKKATGYTFTGFSGDSTSLATEIKGKTQVGDVFVSASPKADAKLQGSANGNWVGWYATFATSPVVLGYNPKSKFAAALKTQPWYKVIAESGIRVGRTDPATDPKGVLTVTALTSAAKKHHESALTKLATSKSDVFPEDTLVGRLQSGQLDAGFFYAAEAAAGNIKTVPLTGENLSASYTITVLNKAPHKAGAVAFINYLLGAAAKPALKKDGFVLVSPPKVTGTGVTSGLSVLRTS